jgi:amino acid transporter
VIGCLAFGPFKSWAGLVSVVSSTTSIMYGFGPISLAALHKVDATRPRTYRVPAPKVVLPAAFISANLITYWGGFDTTWRLATAMAVGLVIFAIGAWRAKTGVQRMVRSALWIAPWMLGHVVIGYLGRYGGGTNDLPMWIDIIIVSAFSLAIFYFGVAMALSPEAAAREVAKDAQQLELGDTK